MLVRSIKLAKLKPRHCVFKNSSLFIKFNHTLWFLTESLIIAPNMINFEHTVFDLAFKGLLEELKLKIQESPNNVHLKDSSERLLIHWAALGGFSHIVGYLIDLGSPVDPRDDIGMTPLILAASANKLQVVQLLIEKGANVNNQNNEGHSSIQYAASKGWKQVLEVLIQHGADVNIMDKRKATPLHRAASKGDINTVSLLLNLGKDPKVNIADSYGNTPLHLACEESHSEIAELLIRHGASFEVKNKDGKTPLELASLNEYKNLKRLIDQI